MAIAALPPRLRPRFWLALAVALVLTPFAQGARAQVTISEFMASNELVLEDEDGDDSDWIELHNAGVVAVDVGGWSLTDDAADLTKWVLPVGTVIAPGGFLVVFASDKDRAVAGQPLHTNFKLKAEGEYLALVDASGATIATEFVPAFPAQFTDVSYGSVFNPGPTGTLSYFAAATPGAPNGVGGVVVAEMRHSPTDPTDVDDVVVEADVIDGPGGPTTQVQLRYRVGYLADVPLPMFDDGTGADLVAGDGTWTAVIPNGASLPGDMLRWYVLATDAGGGPLGRAPLYLDPARSPEYLGTVVLDPSLVSQLPILQWFVQIPVLAATSAGTRASVSFDGEFHDNVYVRLRGGSSTGWPKVSYKFDFNPGNHFRFDPDEGRVEEINVNSTWGDKAFIRQVLSWETYAACGAPGSLSFPLRVEQNGAFHSVAIFVEQPDEDYLDRLGLDDQGALYKMYNTLTSWSFGVEKKTRLWEDNSDLAALVSGITQSGVALEQYLFDNLDLPVVLSHLAATALIHDNDHVAKNYYVYRDSDGDGEWMFLPWDKDLTFGRNYTIGGGVLNDTIWAQKDPQSHPLYGDRNHQKIDRAYNRLIDACYQTARIQEMYLRRLRTVMDLYLQDPATPTGNQYYDNRAQALVAQMQADTALDQARWGIPSWGTMSLDFAGGVSQLQTSYLAPRRVHFFQTHSTPGGGIIPASQPDWVSIGFGAVDASPASGNEAEEYVELTNNNAFAVDVSGWDLDGAVQFTFPPGTVIAAGDSLYVSPDLPAFRARATGPSGGQGLFVVGPYDGDIAPGETFQLYDATGQLVNTTGGPALRVLNLVAGETASLTVAGVTPLASQVIGLSLTGPGPVPTPYGSLLLSAPVVVLPPVPADASGASLQPIPVPPGTTGLPVWFHAFDSGSLTFTGGVALVVQ
jgi:hypothetical protein